ncbi:hypothetical protein TrCOL_g6192 [Triparma columacea]|uniref:Uncharacterized protein n=1 Tax=Triparma columacea TaxID=722753 RepID=A0A9W7FY78_9STRA|nr:hypothetical protein TrCOL_g6192 [Triparma columacea]
MASELPPPVGSDGFIDLGTLSLPPSGDVGSSSDCEDSDNDKTSAQKLMQEMRGSNSFLGMIKKQEYKHPNERNPDDENPSDVDGILKPNFDVEGMMKMEEEKEKEKEKDKEKESLGGLVGDDGIVPPNVFAMSSSFSPSGSWRDMLSEDLLTSAPKNMKIPEVMDEGARKEMEEVERGERSKDQFSKYSGFSKPEEYGEGDDD